MPTLRAAPPAPLRFRRSLSTATQRPTYMSEAHKEWLAAVNQEKRTTTTTTEPAATAGPMLAAILANTILDDEEVVFEAKEEQFACKNDFLAWVYELCGQACTDGRTEDVLFEDTCKRRHRLTNHHVQLLCCLAKQASRASTTKGPYDY